MSDDEFGGLDPTTPLHRASKSKPGRSTTRTEPGPSKSKPATGARKRAAPSPDPDSEIEEVVKQTIEDDESEEVEVQPPPPNKRTRQKPPSRAEAPAANGPIKRPPKAKAKGRAASGKSTRKSPEVEAMDVDTIEIPEDESEEARGPGPRVAAALNQAQKGHIGDEALAAKDRKIGRLEEQLRRANEQIAALNKHADDIHHLRETEPERLLKEYREQAEARFEAQQRVIDELTSQVALKEPLSKAGHMAVLNLLTREAADEEKKTLENEVGKWKAAVSDAKKIIAQKDARIEGLSQQVKELESDLKLEIARSKELAQRSKPSVPPSVPRPGRPGGVEDPKQAVIVQFYEDVTNLIIPNMKQSKGKYLNLDEWNMSCIFTYSNAGEDEDASRSTLPKSLNFTLRLCHELEKGQTEPVVSEKQLVPTVNYVPLELDKESPDFVQSLGFLGAPFTFSRDQLALFLRTMYKHMDEALNPSTELADED